MSRFTWQGVYCQKEEPWARIIALKGSTLGLESSYGAQLVEELKRRIPPGARRWDKETKLWLVDAKYGPVLVKLCKVVLGVDVAVPDINQVAGKQETRILRVEYIGISKDRGNGERSSYAYINGDWNAIFPEAVLKEWFEADLGGPEQPDATKTLYQQLGIKANVSEQDIRSAYRRLARQWHPDVCSEPDAAVMFRQIQHAYSVLSEPSTRAKYNAGLKLEATLGQNQQQMIHRGQVWGEHAGYRPLLRCGYVMCEGSESLGRFLVSKVLAWEDITDNQGRAMVTSWAIGDDRFTVKWR